MDTFWNIGSDKPNKKKVPTFWRVVSRIPARKPTMGIVMSVDRAGVEHCDTEISLADKESVYVSVWVTSELLAKKFRSVMSQMIGFGSHTVESCAVEGENSLIFACDDFAEVFMKTYWEMIGERIEAKYGKNSK